MKAQLLPMITPLEACLRYEGRVFAHPGAFAFPVFSDRDPDFARGGMFSTGKEVMPSRAY